MTIMRSMILADIGAKIEAVYSGDKSKFYAGEISAQSEEVKKAEVPAPNENDGIQYGERDRFHDLIHTTGTGYSNREHWASMRDISWDIP